MLGLLGDALAAVGRVEEAVEMYDRGAVAARESDAAHVRALLESILDKAERLRHRTRNTT